MVVEGTALFHPSGRVQRVEAERVALAEVVDLDLFGGQPRPPFAEAPPVVARAEASKAGEHWLNKIWGKWPGDETDEEIAEIIRELS